MILESVYDDAVEALEALAAVVRLRAREHDVDAREVERARRVCAGSYERLGVALTAYRTLAAALVDGAGTDGKYDLEAATVEARALLDVEVVDTRPL